MIGFKETLPPIHYSDKKTHLDLYKDSDINPLGLSQTLWWATMMMAFGKDCFNGQMNVYSIILNDLSINDEESLLEYLRTKYSDKVAGTIKTMSYCIKNSVITLDKFEPDDEILILNDHPNENGSICAAKTHYSKKEKEFLHNQCIWCSLNIPDSYYEPLKIPSRNDLINKDPARYLVSGNPGPTGTQWLYENCHLVLLEGTVGSGKTTFAELLEKELVKMGFTVINEGTDKYCKTGIPTKNAVTIIREKFKKLPNKNCVVIVDTCGGNSFDNIFGHSFKGFVIHNVRPNYDERDIEGYLSWSLNNVLARSNCDKNSNFYLNPVSTSIQKCKDIHLKKSEAFIKNIPYGYGSDKSSKRYLDHITKDMSLDSQVKNVITKIGT